MTIIKAWAVLFAFVGIQMAWNLQPFVGDRGQPFELFCHNEGNFYTAIIYSMQKFSQGAGPDAAVGPPTISRPGVPGVPELLRQAWPDSSQARGR